MMGYAYIAGTIIFTVYGQMMIKWRLSQLKFDLNSVNEIFEKILLLIKLLLDPFIFSGFVSAFVASLFWMAAMTKFEITYAYPFMSLSPALVLFLGVLLLDEAFTMGKLIGLLVVCLGIFITVNY